jgi:hypothetical protein
LGTQQHCQHKLVKLDIQYLTHPLSKCVWRSRDIHSRAIEIKQKQTSAYKDEWIGLKTSTDLNCRLVVNSGHLKDRLLICFVSRVFNVELLTKFILQDYESSYVDRLKKLNLIPLSYWHEIKISCSSTHANPGCTNLTLISLLPSLSIIPPVPVLVIFFVQICVKRLSSETRTFTELYFYGITCLQISNHPLPSLYLKTM